MKFDILTTKSEFYPDAIMLLKSFGLLTTDISDDVVKLWLAEDNEKLIGVIGIELSQGIGLLRSLAVSPNYQGKGIAGRLCQLVFDFAKECEFDQLFLLTETASDYFLNLGFVEIDRQYAPQGLRATAQFSSLCPDSAAFMVKRTSD